MRARSWRGAGEHASSAGVLTGNVLAYWQAAGRAGAEVVVVPDDEHGQLDVAALERLAGLPGVTVHDLGQTRCAIVTAKIDGLAAEQAAEALARAGINVSTTEAEDNPLDTQDRGVHPLIRFSAHYYNTEDEIDRTTELVAGLAK